MYTIILFIYSNIQHVCHEINIYEVTGAKKMYYYDYYRK